MTERIHCSYAVTQDEDFTLRRIVAAEVEAALASNDHQRIVEAKKLKARIDANAPAPKKAHAHGEAA